MYKKFTPNELVKIEQELDSSSLQEEVKKILKGLIAGQEFLVDLIEKLVTNSGYQRTKIIQEFAKIFQINPPKKKSNSVSGKKSNSHSGKGNDQSDNLSNGSSAGNDSLQPEETKENEKGTEGKDGEDLSGNPPKQEPPKKHPKRGNNDFRPEESHLHFHDTLEPGDQCPKCLLGKVYSFREKVIPILIGRSPLVYEEHRLQTLRCNACGQLFEPKLPEDLPKTGHSMPSAQAALTVLHYKIGVPFASVSNLQGMFYQDVHPAQLWNIIEQTARVLEPVYDELKKIAANSRLFYTDDTTARILSHYPINKENRKKKKRKKDPQDRVGTYSSLIIGHTHDLHEIYLFYHGRKYAGENLADLLVHRDTSLKTAIQMKDASTMNIPAGIEVIESKCNSHAIRKFKDLREIYPKWCEEILKNYTKVSKINQMLLKKGVNDKERLAYHKKHSLPLMEEIKSYVIGLINNKVIEPNSSLGSAIAYFRSHYNELIAFCNIEGAAFENNKAERALKMVIRLRKTSMFYKTEHGAEVAGMLHSLLYTAQEAGINVLYYLQFVLENPDKVRQNPQGFLPWTFQATLEAEKEELQEAL